MSVLLNYRSNLASIERLVDPRPQATRVWPQGADLEGISWDMGDALWEVGDVTGNECTLLPDPGGNPIEWDGQLDELYVEKEASTAHWKIQQTFADGQLLVLEDVPDGLEPGDLVHIRRGPICPGAPLRRLLYMDRPDSKATWGIIEKVLPVPNVPPVDNIMPNPFFQEWEEIDLGGEPLTLPRFWNVDSMAFFTRVDDEQLAKYGDFAAELFIGPFGPAVEHWGAFSDWIPFRPTAERQFLVLQTSFVLTLGIINIYLEIDTVGDGSNIIQIPDQSGERATSARLNERVETLQIVDQSTNVWELGAKRFRVVAEVADPTEFIVRINLDAMQVLQASAPAEAFYDRRASNALWHAAIQYLLDNGEPRQSYDIEILDHFRHDSELYPFLRIEYGTPVRVRDNPLDVDVDTRVVDVQRDFRRGRNTRVQLSNAQPSYTRRTVAAVPRRVRTPAPVPRLASAAGTPDGHLSGIRVELLINPDLDGQDYEEVRWDHTQAVQDGGYTLNIRSTIGGALATGRDPRLESGGGDAVERVGSFRAAVTIGSEGAGTYRVNVYHLELVKGATAMPEIPASRDGDYYVI